MYEDTWAVTPAVNETQFFSAAAIGGAGAVALKTTVAGPYGVAYKVFFRSVGNSSGQSYTIVGHKMGTAAGTLTTETVTGPNATTGVSTNYYDVITSITASGAMTGNQSIGVGDSGGSGTLTTIGLPATRIKRVYYVGGATAGIILVNRNSTTGTELLRVNTPAVATFAAYVDTGNIRTAGSAAATDWALVTPTVVVFYTLICG